MSCHVLPFLWVWRLCGVCATVSSSTGTGGQGQAAPLLFCTASTAHEAHARPRCSYLPARPPVLRSIRAPYAADPPPPAPCSQLVGALRAAPSMDRLEHLVDTYSNHLDAVHVAAALTRLPKLARFK